MLFSDFLTDNEEWGIYKGWGNAWGSMEANSAAMNDVTG